MKKAWIILGTALTIIVALLLVKSKLNTGIPKPIPESETIFKTLSNNGVILDENDQILIDYSIQLPEITSLANEKTILNVNSYYENVYNKSTTYLRAEGYDMAQNEKNRLGDVFLNHTYSEYYEIDYQDDNIFSIIRHILCFSGGSGQTQNTFSEVFRVDNGSLVLLSDIITDTDILISIVKEQISESDKYYDNALELVDELFNPNSFYIKKGSHDSKIYLSLFFNRYDLAPGSSNEVSFHISFDELHDYLTDEYKYLGEIQ